MAKNQSAYMYSMRWCVLFTLVSQILGLKLVRGDWEAGLCQNTKRDSTSVGGQYDTVVDSPNPFQNASDCTLNGCPRVSNDDCLDWCLGVPSVQACEQRFVDGVTRCYAILSPVSSTTGDVGATNDDECYIIIIGDPSETNVTTSSTTPMTTTIENNDQGNRGISGFRKPFVVPGFVFIVIIVVVLRGRRLRAQQINATMNNNNNNNNEDSNTAQRQQPQRHPSEEWNPTMGGATIITIPPPYTSGDVAIDESPPAYDELRKLVAQDRVVDTEPPQIQQRNTNTNSSTNTNANTISNTNSNANTNANSNSNSNSNAYTNSTSNTYTNTNTNTNSNSNSNSTSTSV